MIVKIEDDVRARCESFANERMELSAPLYQARGEANLDKIRADIVTGAVAEFALVDYLRSKGYECSDPDLTIYGPGKKSFAPDLTADGWTIHVKSQTVQSAARYGASWLFQKEDRVLGLPSEHGLMAFCLVDGNNVDIQAIVSVLDIVEAELTSEPKVWKYALSKKAIYLENVLNSNINLWRL